MSDTSAPWRLPRPLSSNPCGDTNDMKLWTRYAYSAALALAALAAACGGSSSNSGTLRLALTDAPACVDYKAVNVTVQKVRVHQSSSAGDNDAGWSEVVLRSEKRINLMVLTNGVLEELGETELPAGRYTQMRLVLSANSPSSPPANSVVLANNAEIALDTPSGTQSGLKMNVGVDVPAGGFADIVLDFEACKSVVKLGNSGRYNLKPVITVMPRVTGPGLRVIGYVSLGLAPSTTSVSVQFNGVPVKSTPPDSTGKFVLYPVPVGVYDLVVNAQGRVTATITGVPVVADANTTVNASSAAINSPGSTATHTASGTVITGTTPVDATVKAIKSYTNGPNVTVADGPVDGTTGSFAYTLPSGAPVKTAYVANAISLAFTADAASPTGLYTISASAGSVTQSAPPSDLTSADSTAIVFTFP